MLKETRKNRTIIGKFIIQRKAFEILRNRKYLRSRKIFINEDNLKEKVAERIKEMKTHREAGKHAIIKNGKLLVYKKNKSRKKE